MRKKGVGVGVAASRFWNNLSEEIRSAEFVLEAFMISLPDSNQFPF